MDAEERARSRTHEHVWQFEPTEDQWRCLVHSEPGDVGGWPTWLTPMICPLVLYPPIGVFA